jgi:hypothetical protein
MINGIISDMKVRIESLHLLRLNKFQEVGKKRKIIIPTFNHDKSFETL